MSNITWADKETGGTFSAANANEVKTAVNSKADALTSDQNYVTDAEKIVIGNTSGTNTGDQDLSGKQNADPQLDTWASITPSANGQSLVSAANYAAMRTLLDLEPGVDYDAATPSTLNLTTDTSITEAQLLSNKFITNLGATGAVTATLPVVTYPITRTFLSSAAQVFSVKPPSGATLETTITPALDVNDKVSLPATIHSKLVVTSVPVGAGWVWSVDGVRGTLTDGGV